MQSTIQTQINKYIKTCNYIKQINSDKARRYKRCYNILMISTLISTIILAAIGFGDINTFSGLLQLDPNIYNFLFNISGLIVLILSILNLLFRFQEKSIAHYNVVTKLASLIREMESILLYNDDKDKLKAFELFNLKYNIILEYLPQHSDKDFIKAKIALIKKNQMSEAISNSEVPKIIVTVFLFF